MTVKEWLASQNVSIYERGRGPYVPRGRVILWRQLAIAKGAQLGFSRAILEIAKARAKPSRRLRWPIGRARPFDPWTIRREDLVRGTLPEFTTYVTKASAEKGYDFVRVQTFLGMLQAQKTRGNKRQGWTPDGQSLEAGA